ncbi:MAG: chemoreceptor glutamine deamidase CheD, partial [Betaproteobacteria bacterium]
DQDMALVTPLGSGVSGGRRAVRPGVGGRHPLMRPDTAEGSDPAAASARYGTFAMELLINELLKRGARRESLEAKVFGGGNVLAGMTRVNVGERNARFVLQFLQVERIRVAARDLLDVFPRKVYFFPAKGRVLVKKLRTTQYHVLIDRENSYLRELARGGPAGDVELFS